MNTLIRTALVRFVLVGLLAGCATGDASRFIWQEDGGNGRLRISEAEIVTVSDDRMSVARILERRGNEMVVREGGVVRTWRVERDGDTLRIVRDEEEKRYVGSRAAAPDLDTAPVRFPLPSRLSAARAQEITAAIDARFDEDQAVRKDRSRTGDLQRVTAENKAYLLQVGREIGWIDAERFGAKTSYRAVILAKHTGDLRLLRGVLSHAERDFGKPGPDAPAFAIVYDELQLQAGGLQRYGTQVCREPNGSPFVCSIETPSAVDSRRATIGLPPLAEYLELVGTHLFGGQAVRIPSDDDVQ